MRDRSFGQFRIMYTSRISLLLLALAVLFACTDNVLAKKSDIVIAAETAGARGEWDQAAVLAAQALEENPKDIDAWTILGDAQMADGDTVKAVSSYEKALRYRPKHTPAILALTDYYLHTADIEDAERVVSTAEAKDPRGKIDEIKVARAQILAKEGELGQATSILASATAKNPKNSLYPKILARIYADKKVLAQAEKYYGDAWKLDEGNAGLAFEYALILQELKKYDEALQLFKVVQERDTSNKTVDYLIGRLYYAAKRWAEAAAQFDKAVAKRPDHFVSNFLLGSSYLEFSKAERGVNFYNKAEAALRKAYELRPDRDDVLLLLVDAINGQNRYMEVDSMLTVLLADTSTDARLWDMLGKARYTLAQRDSVGRAEQLYLSSVGAYLRAFENDTNNTAALMKVVRAYSNVDMLDSALVYANKLSERTPDDPVLLSLKVNICQRGGFHEELISVLAPLLDQGDEYLEKYGLILTNSYLEAGQFANAKETADRVIKMDPAYCDAHMMKAFVDLKRERYAAAVPSLEAGTRACPSNKNMWVYLGDAYYFSAPKDKAVVTKARDAYKRAKDLGSSEGAEKHEQTVALLRTLR